MVLQFCAMVAMVRRWCTPFVVANQVGDTIATMRTIIFMYCNFWPIARVHAQMP